MQAFLNATMGIGVAVATLYATSKTIDSIRARLTFSPRKGPPITPLLDRVEFKNEWIKTSDGEVLHAWYLPSIEAKQRLVIFFHGNAGNISDYIPNLMEMHKLGFALLAVDYRGYGASSGEPTEAGILKDAEATYWYAQHQLGYAPSSIIIYGFSMGSVPATWLSSMFRISGLVVHNGFTSIWDVAKANNMLPFVSSLASVFSTLFTPGHYIRDAKCRVLIVHSRDDDLCPVSLGHQLYRTVAHAHKSFIELIGTHSNFHFSDHFRYQMKAFKD
jgi:uncharacterized protein